MKRIIKLLLKKILQSNETETISDAINRIKYSLLKKLNKKRFNIYELKKVLVDLGLKKGDTVIIHSAWRSFIGFDGKPNDVITCIKDIIGKKGNIIMPAFTNNNEIFRYNDKSSAGVLSEIFRNNDNVTRSLNNMFSMCSAGEKKDYYLNNHINSLYCFDDKSPYYKAIEDNAKILLLGLGKKPHKITLFHCVSYSLRNKVKCYNNVYSYEKKVIIYDSNNKKIEKKIIDRQPQYKNNRRKFKFLFKKYIKKNEYRKINKLDIYLFESKKMYENVYDYILKNNYCIYKK